MNIPTPSIFPAMAALADPLRGRILLLLEGRELAVTELVEAMQVVQSRVSRNLKVLADAGLVTHRGEGSSNRYRLRSEVVGSHLNQVWQLLREEVAALPSARDDSLRLGEVLSRRRSRSHSYFTGVAGEWDRVRGELFGGVPALGLLSLLDASWKVGDFGCGTGHVSRLLAPVVRSVTAVDDSPAMLEAARRELAGYENVEVRSGDISSLPVESASLDVAIVILVLCFVERPVDALREVRRTLRPGGRALVVDMVPHDREELAAEMGHVWRGFGAEQLDSFAGAAGLAVAHSRMLPADAATRGPALFAAVLRPSHSGEE